MKILNFCLIIVTLACITFSCQKDKVDPNPVRVLKEGIALEISQGQNSYIGETGNHFYANTFSQNNDTNLYKLKIKADVKYHMMCTQPGIPNTIIKMELLNSKRETISNSESKDGKPEIFFLPAIEEDLYLSVTLNHAPNEPLSYNLYFEECKPAEFSFMNYNWGASGNWKTINSQTLEFTGSDTREFRWIRLNSIFPDNLDVSFTLKSTTKTKLPSCGVIFSGSSELFYSTPYREELPQKGIFFNLNDIGSYSIQHLDKTAWTNIPGMMSIPGLDIKNGIDITIGHAGTNEKTISINNTILHHFSEASMNKFYLVIEDKGFDKVTFENITFKEDEIKNDYLGTWSTTRSMILPSGYQESKEIITFSETHFENIVQLFDITKDKWINYMSTKGTLSVHNNLMNVHLSDLGISSFDGPTGKFTGNITSYAAGTNEYKAILALSGQKEDFISWYNISDNKMILKIDANDDGDYTDADDVNEYTRQ